MFTQKPNDNRPYLNVNILGQNFLALIDSGSCSSILGSAGLGYLDKWNVPLKSDNSLQVSTADGSVQTCIGYLDLPVRVNNIVKEIKILIIPSVEHQLILGIDFLESFGFTVNFADLSCIPPLCTVNTICPFGKLSDTQKADLETVASLYRCSPLWLVKKSNGKFRICFDGRKLNSVTVSDAYPMPLIDSIITKIRVVFALMVGN
ncbi:hypothetical protein QE152_g9417 [Popillia japonica]|uniref:Peptidase A2 domain-containing protein n=1 Tax=Popillia japonica TaxID=7064 RepID=A0AAW1LYK8_POPJA